MRIVKEQGSKASLYRVFGDKHQLFKAALQNYADIEIRETTAMVSATAWSAASSSVREFRGQAVLGLDVGPARALALQDMHDPQVHHTDFGGQYTQLIAGNWLPSILHWKPGRSLAIRR